MRESLRGLCSLMLKGQRWSPIKVNTRDSGSCDEMLISKCQACPNWVLRFGPQFLCHPLPSLPPTLHDVVRVFLVEHEGVVDPLLALFQAKPVISAGKFSHPKVQIMAGSVWAGYWPPSWPPQVGHLHTVQVATKLVIDVPTNSKTPISHQSIQLINSRLFPLAGLCSQINKYLSPFLEGQCTEPLDELTEIMAERHNFTFKAISTIGFAGAEGLGAEHMLVHLI